MGLRGVYQFHGAEVVNQYRCAICQTDFCINRRTKVTYIPQVTGSHSLVFLLRYEACNSQLAEMFFTYGCQRFQIDDFIIIVFVIAVFYSGSGGLCRCFCSIDQSAADFIQIASGLGTDFKLTLSKIRNYIACSASVGNDAVYSGVGTQILAHGVHAEEHGQYPIQRIDTILWIDRSVCRLAVEVKFYRIHSQGHSTHGVIL